MVCMHDVSGCLCDVNVVSVAVRVCCGWLYLCVVLVYGVCGSLCVWRACYLWFMWLYWQGIFQKRVTVCGVCDVVGCLCVGCL